MVIAQETSSIIPLSKQILRNNRDIVAFRHHQVLYVNDLKRLVCQIYRQLQSSPVTHWAMAMEDSFNFVAGLLALFYAGKHPILLNPLHTELAPHYQAILTDHLTTDQVKLSDKNIINIVQLANNDRYIESEQQLPSDFQSHQLTLFTSGSTGLPKPITKTVTQLEQEISIINDYFGVFSAQLITASVSHEHMYGLTFKIMLALTNQLPFVCETIRYQEQLLGYYPNQIIYITTPSILKMLDSNVEKIVCQKVISAGGPLPYQAAKLCLACFGTLPNEIYGSTETGIIATRIPDNTNVPWQLFPKIKLQIENDNVSLHSPLIHHLESLNDRINLIDDKHFYLKGRSDKIVKISEKRVSLTYIEQQLNQLPEITHASVITLEQKNRTILAAVLILSDLGHQQLQQMGHWQLTQHFRHLLQNKIARVAIPKKWRFVKQFPVNDQGKISYLELKTLFDNSKTMIKKLPIEKNISINETSATLDLYIPDDLFWFKGHFPMQPLLPGVVQLDWVVHYCEKLFAIKPTIEAIDIVKFQMPILPNDNLVLQINWLQESNKLQFTYTVGNKIASTGKIKL